MEISKKKSLFLSAYRRKYYKHNYHYDISETRERRRSNNILLRPARPAGILVTRVCVSEWRHGYRNNRIEMACLQMSRLDTG